MSEYAIRTKRGDESSVTISGFSPYFDPIKVGDILTMANPKWRWWSFWRPRRLDSQVIGEA